MCMFLRSSEILPDAAILPTFRLIRKGSKCQSESLCRRGMNLIGYRWASTALWILIYWRHLQLGAAQTKCKNIYYPQSDSSSSFIYSPPFIATICVYSHSDNWDNAYKVCQYNSSHLLNLQVFTNLTYANISSIADKNELLHIGIRRQYGIFNWVGLNPTAFRSSSVPSKWGMHWQNKEPAQENDCVAINVTTGKLMTVSCTEKLLKFICGKINNRDVTSRLCSTGWKYSPWSNVCLLESSADFRFSDAVLFCKKESAQLISNETYFASFPALRYHRSKTFGVWLNIPSKKSLCYLGERNSSTASSKYHICSSILGTVCEQEPAVLDIKVQMKMKGQRPQSMMFRITNSTKVQCDVYVNGMEVNNAAIHYVWWKNYEILLGGGKILHFNYVPQHSDPRTLQGKYWCEVLLPGYPYPVASVAEEFYNTNISTIIMVIKGNAIPYDPVKCDRSNIAFEKFLQEVQRKFSEISLELAMEYPKLPLPYWEVFNVSKVNGSTTLKVNILFDHGNKIRKDEKHDFFNPVAIFLYNYCQSRLKGWRVTMCDVNNIGICFSDTTITMLGNITWNQVYHSKYVTSSPMCLNAGWNILTRNCYGGYGVGAYWSPFDANQCVKFNKVLENANHHQCQPGYSSWNYSTCIRVYTNPATWSEAVAECGSSLGFLLTPRLHSGDSSFVHDFNSTFKMFERLGDIWLGGHRENGMMQWIAFEPGPIGLEESDLVEWEEEKDQKNDCVSGIVHNGKISIKSKPCEEKKPYVCMHKNPEGKLYPTSDCGENWYGSPLLDTCYMVNNESLTWQDASNRCRTYSPDGKGTLVVLTSPEENDLIKNHLLTQTSTENATWWIGLERIKNNLLWLDGNNFKATYVDWEPGVLYNLSVRNISAIALRRVDNMDDIWWVQLNPNTNSSSVCQTRRRRGLAQCHISAKRYTDGLKSDGRVIYECKSKHAVYDSITWYKDGVAVYGSRGLIETASEFWPLMLHNSTSSIFKSYCHVQGYYWCEVQQHEPFVSVASSKVLYIDERCWTFVCYLTSTLDIGQKSFWNARKNLEILLKKTIFASRENKINTEGGKSSTISLFDDVFITDLSRTDNGTEVRLFIYHKSSMSKVNSKSTKRKHLEKLREYILKEVKRNPGSNFLLDAIMNTDVCFSEETDVGEILNWEDTPFGRNATPVQLCTDDNGYPTVRRCLGNFTHGVYWEPFKGNCFKKKSDVTLSLEKLSKEEVKMGNVKNISQTLEILTKNSNDLIGMDIHYVAKTLENIASKGRYPASTVEAVAGVINNVLEVRKETIRESQMRLNTSSRIVTSLETVLEDSIRMTNVIKPNIGIVSSRIKDGNVARGLKVKDEHPDGFEQNDVILVFDDLKRPYNKTLASISLPLDLVKRMGKKTSYINFIVYRNATLFVDSDRAVVVSPIISAFFTREPVQFSSSKIEAVFKTWQVEQEVPHTARCVYWEQNMNHKKGGWSTAGCNTAVDLRSEYIVCRCNHLTSFAVLVDLYPSGEDSKEDSPHAIALDIITYLGCTLSIFGLVLTIVTFALFRKLRNGLGNQVLCNLAVSLLLSLIVFLAGINQTHWKPGCMLVAGLLHYLLMVAFSWMLVEAVLQYLRLVKVIGTYIPRFMLKASVCAWGIPLIIVIIILSVDYELYYSKKNYCWISMKAFYYGFLLPLALVMACNITIFAIIIYSITCGRQRGLRSNQDERKLIITRLRAACCILVLLGLSWTFGFLAISDARLVFKYLFSIFTTLQGFFIFLFHVVQEKKTRNLWYHCIFYKDSQVHTLTTRDTTTSVSRNK